jgi:hypothetical protein
VSGRLADTWTGLELYKLGFGYAEAAQDWLHQQSGPAELLESEAAETHTFQRHAAS